MKIIADNKIPFLKGVLEPYCEIFYELGANINAEIVKDKSVIITRTRTICNKKLLDDSSVELITTATIGYDHIDTKYCDENNISWFNAPGCNANSVAQYLTATLLEISVKYNFTLRNKVLGIIGVGNVGSIVAEFAKHLGMRILLNDPPRERREGSSNFVEIDKIIKDSDFITVHTPLIRNGKDKSYHLVDGEFLSKMKESAFLINSSRGETVDNLDLLNALKNKEIRGAILDVWENEPNINFELQDMLEIATPHIAGYSSDGKANGTSISVANIAKRFDIKELFDWYPNIPNPINQRINITEQYYKSNNFEQILLTVIRESYDILLDNRNLQKTPENFESLRGNYRTRREFPTFQVKIPFSLESESLKKLGFYIL